MFQLKHGMFCRQETHVRALISQAKGQVGRDEPMADSTAAAIAEVQAALHNVRATILQDADLASTLPSTRGTRRARAGAPLSLTTGTTSLRTAGPVTLSGAHLLSGASAHIGSVLQNAC